MKKNLQILILLLSCLFASPNTQASDLFANLDPATEKLYWDYLSERLIHSEKKITTRFQEEHINVWLQDATRQDSLIVIPLLEELKKLIPTKKLQLISGYKVSPDEVDIALFYPILDSIGRATGQFDFVSNHFDLTFSDTLGNKIEYSGIKGQYQPEIYTQYYRLGFNGTLSFEQRKQYTEYCILWSLCAFNGNKSNYEVDFEYAIFNNKEFNPENTRFSEADKFLINKLYSTDFEKQLKKHIIKNYSRKVYYEPYLLAIASGFSYNIAALLIGLILFFVFYKSVFIRKYYYRYTSYLVPAISIAFIIIVTTGILGFPAFIDNPFSDYFDYFWHLTLRVVSVILIFVHFLYLIEVVLIKKLSINKQNLIKVLSLPLAVIIYSTIQIVIYNFNIGTISIIGQIFFVTISVTILRAFWLYAKNLNQIQLTEKEIEISHLKELKTKAELQSLHSRINPHFLYNSLNTIAGLAKTNAGKTEQMALALSDLFRYTINRNGDQLTTIDEEVTMATTYLEVEKIRFGERMNFTIHLDEKIRSYPIPKFIVQPLIENAIKHGVSQIKGNGEVSLTIQKEENEIIIEVKDNGPNFPEGLISGYGLQSIFDILKLSYGEKAGINWRNAPDKAIVINLPYQEQS